MAGGGPFSIIRRINYIKKSTYLGEILIDERRILDEMTDVGVEDRAAPLGRGCQLGGLGLHGLESLGQFFLRDLIRFRFLGKPFHTFHERLHADLLFTYYARRGWRRRHVFCKDSSKHPPHR